MFQAIAGLVLGQADKNKAAREQREMLALQEKEKRKQDIFDARMNTRKRRDDEIAMIDAKTGKLDMQSIVNGVFSNTSTKNQGGLYGR